MSGIELLASICEHGSTEELHNLTDEHFVDEEEVELYNFIKHHYRRNGRLPLVDTLVENHSFDIPLIPEPLQYYKDQLEDRYIYQQAHPVFNELHPLLGNGDYAAAQEVAARLARTLSVSLPERRVLDTGTLMQDVLDEYQQHHQRPGHSGVTTGWSYLDQETGGYQNGDLVVWVARPAMGKTWLLLHQTHAAWLDGRSALFVSMEMTLKQVGRRFGAYHAGVDPDAVRKGTLSRWGEQRFTQALRDLGNANSLNWFAGGMSKTSEQVDMLIQEYGPDIIYIDGIYLMQPANAHARMGRYERAAYMVDELKTIALKHDRPVVVTTQFGRDAGSGGKKGTVENIGYTDAFGTHASLILGVKGGKRVHVPEISRTLSNGEKEVLREARDDYPYREIELLKGREGESGSYGCNFSFGPTNFSQAPLDEVRERQGQVAAIV